MAKSFKEDCVNYIIDLLIDKSTSNNEHKYLHCIQCNENKAYFGIKNYITHCKECAKNNMKNNKNLNNKTCIVCNVVTASYGIDTSTHCFNCSKGLGLKCLRTTMCIICNHFQPVYGYEQGKPTHCKNCKLEDMKAVRNKKCEDCGLYEPNYGFTKSTHCKNCSLKYEGMIKTKIRKKCSVCKKGILSYGLTTDKLTHCAYCKTDEMVSRHAKCVICNKNSYYGYTTSNIYYCFEHKKDDMMPLLTNTNFCIICNKTRASFSKSFGSKATHCLKCMEKEDDKDEYVRSFSKPCKNYEICCNYESSNKDYDGYCFFCFRHLYPEKVSNNYKTKENYVKNYILNYFTDIELTFDKKISNGCSYRRPDCLYDAITHCVMYEIDEEQHINNELICENKKIMEEFIDLGNRPIVILRFNPDNYILDGKKINSPWKKNLNNTTVLYNEKEMNNRINILIERFKYHINNIPKKEVTIEKLYYDNIPVILDKTYNEIKKQENNENTEQKVETYKYNCEKCDYHTDKKSNYDRHLKSIKHNK